jgi:hypothetical protein
MAAFNLRGRIAAVIGSSAAALSTSAFADDRLRFFTQQSMHPSSRLTGVLVDLLLIGGTLGVAVSLCIATMAITPSLRRRSHPPSASGEPG